MPELETVDLPAVEILSVGGPVRAIGSPPEGDYFTTAQLREMAAAAAELGGELKAPARIGHRRMGESREAALRASPAVGWLENQRLSEDGKKLLADVRDVPRRFAEIVKKRGYRTRSSELSKITSQKTGKTYDYVVTGMAWLGAELPAVQTLDDVVALYEGEAERQVIVEYDGADSSGEALEAILKTLAEKDGSGSGEPAADTRPVPTFTEKQRKSFAEATGLAVDKVTDEMLDAAGVVEEKPADPTVSDEEAKEIAKTLGVEGEVTGEKLLAAAKAKAETDDEGDGDGDGDKRHRELERRLESAEKTANDTAEELRVERRMAFVEAAIKEGRIKPGAREKLERLYDKDPSSASEFVAELDPDEELVREYGSDEPPADEQEALEKAYVSDASVRLGIPEESLV